MHPDPLTAVGLLDPLRPLGTEETDRYVDWQSRLEIADDVKLRLANSIARSAGPATRLFTGHRGAGKTTELNRVRQRLQDGIGRRKVSSRCCSRSSGCTSTTSRPRILVFQIVRQLVSDLDRAGFSFARTRFQNTVQRVRDFLRGRFAVEGAMIGVDPLTVSLRFEAFPNARKEFRALLQGSAAADLGPHQHRDPR